MAPGLFLFPQLTRNVALKFLRRSSERSLLSGAGGCLARATVTVRMNNTFKMLCENYSVGNTVGTFSGV